MNEKERALLWEGCYNIRDLGQLATHDGRRTRLRAIVRSDLPSRLTAKGRQQLLSYGIRTILDLRKPDQVAKEEAIFREEPTSSTPIYCNILLENHSAEVDEQIRLAGSRREAVYALILDHNQPQVAEIMQAIVEALPGGILIHCSAGKDRTGIITALLLELVGVSDETIAADYALSQVQLWPLYEKLIQEAGGEEHVSWWLKPIATPAMILYLLAHLRNRYGSVVDYLRGAGVSAVTLAALRTRLLC